MKKLKIKNSGIITKIMCTKEDITVNISLDLFVEEDNVKYNIWFNSNNEAIFLEQNSDIKISLPDLNCMDLLGKKVDFEINDDFNKEKVNKKGEKFRDCKIVGVTILNKI